jgi:outer membrane protein assembly factor BamD
LALGLPDEARRNAAVLGKNYPGTYWYRQSLRLLLKEQKQTGLWTAGGVKKKK